MRFFTVEKKINGLSDLFILDLTVETVEQSVAVNTSSNNFFVPFSLFSFVRSDYMVIRNPHAHT